MLKITFVIPPLFFNKDSTGFNEMLASELIAICEKNDVKYKVCIEKPDYSADIYVLPVQYREDIFSEWFRKCVEHCKSFGGLVFVCGKSSSVEYRYILKHTETDYVALGEFELTLDELIKYMSKNSNVCNMDGIKSIAGLA